MRLCSRLRMHWVLVLKGFYLKAGILGVVSGGDLNRIFISFPGVSFNMLTHQSEHIDHSLVSFTFKECYLKETRTDRSTLAWSGMCKIKTLAIYYLAVNCLPGLFNYLFQSQFPHSISQIIVLASCCPAPHQCPILNSLL